MKVIDTALPKIRRARSTDAPQVIAGIDAICDEGGSFYTTRFVSTPQWEAVLHHPETVADHMLAVAELDEKIVGAGRLFPGGTHTLMNHVAELGLFVLQPFRRQGIGTRLVDCLIGWARENKIEKITLTVFSTNKPAIQFFVKHHFAESGRMIRQLRRGRQYIDLLLMERFLS